jgi:HNH endonuclease
MKKITLTQNQYALVDDEDFEYLNQWNWYAYISRNKFYVMRYTNKKRFSMHNTIMNPDSGLEVDHIDGNGLNNQKSNLRVCTHSENSKNRLINKNNKTGYKGVTWHKSHEKFQASIGHNGKQIHLGYFYTAEEASTAYNMAALKYHKKFSSINH